MSLAAVADSALSYSFTLYFPFKTEAIDKDHPANNGDSWRLTFNYSFSTASLTLTKRNVGDCCFIVKLSVLDGERQSKLDLVQKGWKSIGSCKTFTIPGTLAYAIQQKAGQMALQMTITKIVQPSMADMYSKLFKSDTFGDVEIECGDGVKFRCHKDMLAARSHHFATMFNLKMKESVENRIRIEDFNSDVVSVLLRFVYMGDWGDLSNVADGVYKAADRYQLEQLKLAAAAVLIGNLNAESIVPTYRLAHLYKDKLLGDGCEDYLACHKGEISMMEVMAEVFKNQ